MNKRILHAEGLFVLLLSGYFYSVNEYSWLLFFLLLLAPDLSMLGYIVNNKIGVITYNIFHTYCLSITIIFIGLVIPNDVVLAIGLIWNAHIGMDRMVGYGLKYPSGFKETHLNRV